MNKPIRCTTHFHACDCREYEFEMMKKENQEMREALKALAKNTSDYFSNIEPEGCCNGHMCGCLGMPTNPEYYIKEQADEAISKFNLSENPNSSKEGVK